MTNSTSTQPLVRKPTSRLFTAIPLLALFSSACSCGGGSGNATAEIGTGTTAFMPISAEQDLELIAGPQGGFHFIVNASMTGISPGDPAMPGLLANPETEFAIFAEDGARLDAMIPPYRLGYRERNDEPGVLQLPSGRILALSDDVLPTTVYDQRVRLRVEIRGDGGSAIDEVFVIGRERIVELPDAGVDAATPDAAL